MIDNYHAGKDFPQDIVQQMKPESSVILTAGYPEYQHAKVRGIGLGNFPVEVVLEGKDKILATIRYIFYKLKYIPSKIVVFEDRPEYFVKYRSLIEEIFNTELTVMYVQMDGNRGYRIFEEISD